MKPGLGWMMMGRGTWRDSVQMGREKQEKFERDIVRCWCDPGWAEKRPLSQLMVCGLSMAESENAEVRQVADENVEMRHLATEKRKETIAPTVSDENKEIEKKQVAEQNMKEKTAVTTTINIKDMNWKILEEGKKELQKLDIGWNTMR